MKQKTYYDPERFMGITHIDYFIFRIRFNNLCSLFYRLWKRLLCPHHVHLFDECYSGCCLEEEVKNPHYLICDACGLMINIESIETTYCDVKFKEEK
jgi:hypothetical protein